MNYFFQYVTDIYSFEFERPIDERNPAISYEKRCLWCIAIVKITAINKNLLCYVYVDDSR